MAPLLVTLNDIEGHSPVAGLFKCNPSNICAVFYQISTDSASRGPSARAGLLVINHNGINKIWCNIIEIKSESTAHYVMSI